MKNCDESVEINHNPNSPCIPDHLYRTLIIRGSGSGKTNVLLNLIKNQRQDIDQIYLFVKKVHSNQSINYLLMEEKK